MKNHIAFMNQWSHISGIIDGWMDFTKGEQIRWGYKLWVGATVDGYIEWFEPYQGSISVLSDKYKYLDLGASVV